MEDELLGYKPCASPIDSKPNFWDSTSSLLAYVHAYCRLVRKLTYLNVTSLDKLTDSVRVFLSICGVDYYLHVKSNIALDVYEDEA